jgi:hypothetical protein
MTNLGMLGWWMEMGTAPSGLETVECASQVFVSNDTFKIALQLVDEFGSAVNGSSFFLPFL